MDGVEIGDVRGGRRLRNRGCNADLRRPVELDRQGDPGYPETTQRADDFSGIVEKFGAHIVSLFWTVGAYDLVTVVEAQDAETLTAALLRLGALGNVRTTTMRAFRQDEKTGIVAKAGAS